MNKTNATATWNISQILLDLLTVSAAYLIALALYSCIGFRQVDEINFWMDIVFSITFILSMIWQHMYNVTTFYYFDRIVVRTLVSTLVSGFCLSMVVFLLKLDETSRLTFLLFTSTCFVLVVAQRTLLKIVANAESVNGRTRVIFIGDERAYKQFSHYVSQTAMRYKFVGLFSMEDRRINTAEKLERFLVTNQVDEVILHYQPNSKSGHKKYMSACKEMGITVHMVIDMIDLPDSGRFVSRIGSFPVITYHSVPMDRGSLFVKSAMDLVFSAICLLMLSPLFLAVALAIKLESPGPVFFRQKRAGRNGKVFKIYKFRSMYMDAEQRKQELLKHNKIKNGLMFKMDNDPRITKVGAFLRKTSIDELPQLINVIRGEMSLVGTRPPTLDEVANYERRHRSRISIKPGITGMWQVSGRSNITDFEQVVSLDNQYIRQWSLGLDLKILLKTVSVVFLQRGAS